MEMDMVPVSSSMEVMPTGTPSSFSADVIQQEPPMHLHRPSSDRAQDVSHILTSLFEDLYTKDVMARDTVENLTLSGDGSTVFHKKCMKELSQVQEKHKKILNEYNVLERHIIQARARGASADVSAREKTVSPYSASDCEKLGLPPVDSHFRWCVDEAAMKKYKLIVPSDLFSKVRHLIDGPKRSKAPHFSLPTLSSEKHFLKERLDDGYNDHVTVRPPPPSLEDLTTLSSDSADRVSVPPRHRIKQPKQDMTEKERWREDMKPGDRMKDRELLARLEGRHNYLKNPRFLPMSDPRAARLLTKQSEKESVLKAGRAVIHDVPTTNEFHIFEASPPVVMFTEWTVGRVYETVLNLLNLSAVARHLRVLPPSTSYFSLTLGKYPGDDGLVAPGVSPRFNVRFMPDSLADYEDELQVLSQASQPLIVKILAKREPPALTISKKINCGSCLVGGAKSIELPIKNVGGSGKFCILKRSMWPAANFKTVVKPDCLDLGTFLIRPSVFEIPPGRSVCLEIVFSPADTKKYSEELVIVCDNCQTIYFSLHGEGERAGIELVSVSDGGEDQHRMGEIADLTASHLVTFPSLNSHSFYMRQIILHNSSNVELPYSWHMLKPNLISPQDQLMSDVEVDWETLEFCPDDSPCFFVEPMQGVLQPDGIHEFVLTFAPHQVGSYRNALHLVLSDIPDSKFDLKNQPAVGKMPPSVDVMEKISPGSREDTVNNFSRSVSFAQSSKFPSFKQVISLEVEVSGECIPYAVVLHPLAVVVTGNILIGTTVRRPVQMANYSLAPVHFNWVCETSPNIVEVKPPVGVVGPGEIVDLEVTVTGLQCGPLACDLFCKLEHQDEPLKLSVVAHIDGPTVVIDNMRIDFGLLKLGDSPTEQLFIRNTTQLNAHWSIQIEDQESFGLAVWPQRGALASLEQQAIKVKYFPSSCQSLSTSIHLDVEDGHGSSVAVHAEVQTPQVCFRDCMMVLKEVYLSVPKPTTAILVNQTSFPTAFNFQPIKGNQECDVTVNPPSGVLGPREEREIEASFISHTSGEVCDVYLPCKIEGMNDLIVLGFYADVQLLSVEFSTPFQSRQELRVLFDDPTPVGSTANSIVVVTNCTAIRAPWTAEVEYFKTSKPLPKPPSYDFKSVKTRRALLGRTPNLADPLSKTPSQTESDHKAMMLSDGRGAAFALDPPRGFLEPFQSQKIRVLAYNNMWGEYRDNMVISIEGIQTKTIPVELNVTGCPLVFQMSRDESKDAIVRFGSHLEGGHEVARKLRINNSSCCDIRLDFRTFNYPDVDDRKLIDVNVWFGDAFPLKCSTTSHSKHTDLNLPVEQQRNIDAQASDDVSGGGQPKIVSVRVDPHMGVKSTTPFRMDPEQAIVPAHGHVTVTSIFNPLLHQCSDDEGRKYSSYSLGFMSLDGKPLKHHQDKLLRHDAYSVKPLRLELTSFVRAGKVHVETEDDEDTTSFHLPLSELARNGKDLSPCQQHQTLTLVNPTEAVLNFNLSVRPPFYLAMMGSSRKYHSLSTTQLTPQSNLKVNVGIYMDEKVVEDLNNLRSDRPLEGVTLQTDPVFGNQTLVYESHLCIRYCNGIAQLHPLAAHISCPSFKILTENLVFETSFVGQEVHQLVTIVNQSGADTRWRARVEDTSDPKVGQFRVEPCEGILEAFTSHSASMRTTISVFFLAKDEGPCSGRVVLRGTLDEPVREIRIQANGSFDGKFELK